MAGNRTVVLLSSAASLLIGGGIGYIVAAKRLGAEFDERLERETAEMRTFYTIHENGKKKYDTAEEAAAALHPERKNGTDILRGMEVDSVVERVAYDKIVKKYAPADEDYAEGVDEERISGSVTEVHEPDGTIRVTEMQHSNVFAESTSQIYVISAEEFNNDEADFIQSTVQFYAGDGVLCDNADDKIEDIAGTLGNEFQDMFGVKSGDPNVVHVRNTVLQLEFEVLLNPGFYSQEVLGQEPPIVKPSDRIRRGE